MSGVRGAKNPMPAAGGKPTGMFSSSGTQKVDPLSKSQAALKSQTGGAYKPNNPKPKHRDNGLK